MELFENVDQALGPAAAGPAAAAAQPAADADPAAGFANALTQHDRVRRSTDIPLFHGNRAKDTITPQQLIERLDRAARVARWNDDERKCDEFFLCLRGDAIAWANTLDNLLDFDKGDWDSVKEEFLKAYSPRYSARTLCVCMQDLRQTKDESVQAFYNKVSEMFRNAYQYVPVAVTTCEGDRGEANQDDANMIMTEGVKKMKLLMMNTIFLGGLREDIRARVLEEQTDNIQDSVDAARKQEVILQDRKAAPGKGLVVASVGSESEEFEVSEEEAQQMAAVNAILKKKGQKQLPTFRVKRGSNKKYTMSGNASADRAPGKLTITCYFCQKPGHRERDCFAKKRARAAAIGEVEGQVNAVAPQPALNW